MKKFFASVLLFALTAFAIADAQTVNPGGKLNAGVTAFINCATNGGIVYNANGVINCSAGTITAAGQPTFLSTVNTTPSLITSNSGTTFAEAGRFTAPNLSANAFSYIWVGKNTTAKNYVTLAFRWQADSSTANSTEFIFNGDANPTFSFTNAGVFGLGVNAGAANMQLAGTTSAFPKITRNGVGVDFQLADGSNYAPVTAINYTMGGTQPVATGSCAVNTQTGGMTAGTFKANGVCAAGTVILTFANTVSPHGWACQATDQTTPADVMNQTASTTTSVTFTGTMANLDVVVFSCLAY